MRRRLTILVAATTSLVLVAFLVPLAFLIRTMAADRAIAAATTQAQSLATVVATADRATLSLAVEQAIGASAQPITVFFADGATLGSRAARSQAVDLAARGRSLTVTHDAGREILVAVQGLPEGPAVIRTFVPNEDLYQGVTRAWVVLSALGLILLVVGLLVADQLALSLVRPIRRLATVSHRLARGDLAARAAPSGPPELREVAIALNHLAGRITDLVAQERERVADISHRLRTPLTALRLNADSLRDPAEAALVRAGVDAVERAISQVIEDARKPVRHREQRSADAAAVVRDRVDFWAVLAEDQERSFDADVPTTPVRVGLTADELVSVVDALLGNVFAHTPDGTGFAVRLTQRAGGGAVLEVRDAGPGFRDPDAVRRGASGSGSTGLGLDIARRAARQSGGGLTIGSAPRGGALVRVELGPPTS